MYISNTNKALARSLDVCLGEGVVALMPAPPFFPGGCLVGHRILQIIPIIPIQPYNLFALAGGRHSDCPQPLASANTQPQLSLYANGGPQGHHLYGP